MHAKTVLDGITVYGGAMDKADLAHVRRLYPTAHIVAAQPAPKSAKGYRNITASRFVLDTGEVVDCFTGAPVYYHARDGSWRPMSEVAFHAGNTVIVLVPWALKLMHPHFLAWLRKRQARFKAGRLIILGEDGGHTKVENRVGDIVGGFAGLPTHETEEQHRALAHVGDRMAGKRFTTSTFYPDAGTGATTVDGVATRDDTSTFASIHDGNGTRVFPTNTALWVAYMGTNASSQFQEMDRGFFLFDTSSIPDVDAVTAAVFSGYAGNTSIDSFAEAGHVRLTASSPAVDDDLAAADYQGTVGNTTAYATDITVASWLISQYNDITMNATGRAAISKTGITKLGTRIKFDADNTSPTVAASKGCAIRAYLADNGSNQPKLVVTHVTPNNGLLLVMGS